MRKHDVSPHINRITLWSATCVTYTCSLARLAGRSGPEGFAGLRLAGAWLVRALALLGGVCPCDCVFLVCVCEFGPSQRSVTFWKITRVQL